VTAAAVTATSAHAAGVLTGSYRVTLRAGDLVRAGAPSVGAMDDTGVWTLTFVGPRWTLRQEHAPIQDALDRGVIVLRGNQVGFVLLTSDGASHRVFLGTFRWRLSGGTLRFSPVAHQFPTSVLTILVTKPWQRVR
jgi:hypothetical protein